MGTARQSRKPGRRSGPLLVILQRILIIPQCRIVARRWAIRIGWNRGIEQARALQFGKSGQVFDRFQPEMVEELRRGAECHRTPRTAAAAA